MANRNRRPKTRRFKLSGYIEQGDRNITPITGQACAHGTCKQVRTMATSIILGGGKSAGIPRSRLSKIVAHLPGLLCEPAPWPPRGLNERECRFLAITFVVACLEHKATSLIGQTLPWYEPIKADVTRNDAP